MSLRRWVGVVLVGWLVVWQVNDLITWQRVQKAQDLDDLKSALETLLYVSVERPEMTVKTIETVVLRGYGDDEKLLTFYQRRQLNQFVEGLERLLQQEPKPANSAASRVFARTLYGVRQAYTEAQPKNSLVYFIFFFEKLVAEMGPELVLDLYYILNATSQLAWEANFNWAGYIPVIDHATLWAFFELMAIGEGSSVENAAKVISQLGTTSKLALNHGVTAEAQQSLARMGYLTRLAVDAQVALTQRAMAAQAVRLDTTKDFEVLTTVEDRPVDFKLRSLRLLADDSGQENKVSAIVGIVEPWLENEAEMRALFGRMDEVDKAFEKQHGTEPAVIAVVVGQVGNTEAALCEQVRAQRTHAFVVVLLDGGVTQDGTCHSVQSDQPNFGRDEAQRVCADLEVALCRPRAG